MRWQDRALAWPGFRITLPRPECFMTGGPLLVLAPHCDMLSAGGLPPWILGALEVDTMGKDPGQASSGVRRGCVTQDRTIAVLCQDEVRVETRNRKWRNLASSRTNPSRSCCQGRWGVRSVALPPRQVETRQDDGSAPEAEEQIHILSLIIFVLVSAS